MINQSRFTPRPIRIRFRTAPQRQIAHPSAETDLNARNHSTDKFHPKVAKHAKG